MPPIRSPLYFFFASKWTRLFRVLRVSLNALALFTRTMPRLYC